MTAVKFTDPALCHYNQDITKQWFVYFDVSNGEKIIRMQKRGRINKTKIVKERLKTGNALATFWKQKLNAGWNPFEPEDESLAEMSLTNALQFALDECKVSKATFKAYRLCAKYIIDGAKLCHLDRSKVCHLERKHVKLILKKCMAKYKWTNKAYNKNHNHLSALLGRLVDWEILKFNPAEKIKSLPVTETQKFIPYTTEEKERIREYFYLNHYRYFIILMIIYHTGMRPKEVLALKIKDVDLSLKIITIYPEIELENSKTKTIRKIPVNNHLLPFLIQLQLENYPLGYYVFGSLGRAKGIKGSAMHPDYFKPSAIMIKRDTITKLWKKIVIDKLGINKYQYAMKHTGANSKILSGISIDALQHLYGHSSKLMTMKYIDNIKEIYNNEIREKSPQF